MTLMAFIVACAALGGVLGLAYGVGRLPRKIAAVRRLQVVQVLPDDVIVLQMPRDASNHTIEQAANELHGRFPDNVCFILPDDVRLETLRPVTTEN